MENQNIVMLRHHFLNVKTTNAFYTNQCPNLSDYVIVDVTSKNKSKELIDVHELSPFFIGPCTTPDGKESLNFENFWQFCKVYNVQLDQNNEPSADWFTWREEGFSSKKAVRHPNKKLDVSHADTSYVAWYDPATSTYSHLGYIEARKKIYFPFYASLIANSKAFATLKQIVDDGKKLALIDFDAYNYYDDFAMKKRFESFKNKFKDTTLKEDDFHAIKNMKDVVNCSFLSAGHGFVIKALLQGDIEVVNGEVIDKTGILEN